MTAQISTPEEIKKIKNNSIVYQRQMALYPEYIKDPGLAMITDSSVVKGLNLQDPFRNIVSINDHMKIPFQVGVHKAVGGDHDFPNPGDILCAALAACLESTIRMVANILGIELLKTQITASAKVDVRGTLMIDKTVPVGFQSMHLDVVLTTQSPNEKMLNVLFTASKASCIVYQTIKQGTPITLNVTFETITK